MKKIFVFGLCLAASIALGQFMFGPNGQAFQCLPVVSGGSPEVVTNGLLAWWRFDEGTGTSVADSSGNGKTGTLSGTGTGYTWTTSNGAHGAIQFDGTDGKMALIVDSLSSTNSFSFWFYPIPSSDGYASLLTVANNYGIFYRGSLRTISFYTGGDDLLATTFTENAWHHVVIVTDISGGANDRSIFYVDGVVDTAVSGRDYARATFDAIGNDTSSESFKGKVSNFRIYNRQLSASEVTTLFNNP